MSHDNHMTLFTSSSDSRQLAYCSNKLDEVRMLGSGTYTLSNEFLNSPWAKTTHGKKLFEEVISRADVLTKEQLTEQLLEVLSDTTWYVIHRIIDSGGPLYSRHPWNKYKCPDYRGVLISGVNLYYKAQFGTFVSILNTGVSSFQGVPNKVLL